MNNKAIVISDSMVCCGTSHGLIVLKRQLLPFFWIAIAAQSCCDNFKLTVSLCKHIQYREKFLLVQ